MGHNPFENLGKIIEEKEAAQGGEKVVDDKKGGDEEREPRIERKVKEILVRVGFDEKEFSCRGFNMRWYKEEEDVKYGVQLDIKKASQKISDESFRMNKIGPFLTQLKEAGYYYVEQGARRSDGHWGFQIEKAKK